MVKSVTNLFSVFKQISGLKRYATNVRTDRHYSIVGSGNTPHSIIHTFNTTHKTQTVLDIVQKLSRNLKGQVLSPTSGGLEDQRLKQVILACQQI